MRTIHRLSIAAACCALSGGVPAQAQIEPVNIDAQRCSAQAVGGAIDPKQIGEPVSGVTLDRINWHEAGERSPALCVVEGQILPVDQSATARPIRFAVALPGTWNRRSIHQGGGGMNGSVPQFAPNPQRPGFGGGGGGDVARGFAVYGSDSGHGAQDTQWALNDEAIRNFGFAQLKKTHDVAQILIARLYGAAPRYRYFVGTSQGGREALTVAQRYPADYDGVAANVPVVELAGLMESPVAIRRQERPLANHVPQAKAKAVAAEFMRQCDGLDGLDDGVINHYLACRDIFNVNDGQGTQSPWAARRCPDGRDPDPADASESACFTDGQIQTLHFIFSSRAYPAPMARGDTSFGMWPPSTEVAVGGLPPASGNSLLSDIRYQGQEGAAPDARVFGALGSLGLTGFVLRDTAANPLTYTEGAALLPRRRQVSEWVDSTDPDLSAFQRRGGKLIVAIGTNDTLASPGAQLDYYAALVMQMGWRALDGFARLYVLPQRGHGLTGNAYTRTGSGRTIEAAPLPSQFDRLTLLQKWVEQGEAPSKAETVAGARGTSGLMCSYPAHPHYLEGAPDQAASWRCRE